MSLLTALARLFGYRPAPMPPPTPAPVPPAPAPSPTGDRPPAELRAAFDLLNAARARHNRTPFRWDDRLYRSGQEHCQWCWDRYLAGQFALADGHHDQSGRLVRAGWPMTDASGRYLPGPPDGRLRTINYSECAGSGTIGGDHGYPPDLDGWHHPPEAAESWMRDTVAFFDARWGSAEPHVLDFRAGYTHVGIGHHEGFTVIEYGYLPFP